MKSLVRPVVLAVAAASVLAALSGCNSPGGDARPDEIRPGVARRVPGVKGPQSAIPITVVKVVPSPTPLAKGKKVVRRKSVEMPANTGVPFTFSIGSAFWPPGVESVSATIKCYQVASVYTPQGGGYAITTTGTPLAVFPNNQESKTITITPTSPQTVELTFSGSSCLNKELFVGITGTGENGNEEMFDFGGGEIFVVSQ